MEMLWERGWGALAQRKLPGRNDTWAVIKDQWELGKDGEEEGRRWETPGHDRGFLSPWCEQREKNMRGGEAGDEAAGGKEVLLSNTSSWRFAPSSDEKPRRSFRQGRGEGFADVLQENKEEESHHKGKQNYFNSPNERWWRSKLHLDDRNAEEEKDWEVFRRSGKIQQPGNAFDGRGGGGREREGEWAIVGTWVILSGPNLDFRRGLGSGEWWGGVICPCWVWSACATSQRPAEQRLSSMKLWGESGLELNPIRQAFIHRDGQRQDDKQRRYPHMSIILI